MAITSLSVDIRTEIKALDDDLRTLAKSRRTAFAVFAGWLQSRIFCLHKTSNIMAVSLGHPRSC
jgi:hypothetical protein